MLISEVQYYFRIRIADTQLNLVMVSNFGEPNSDLLQLSLGALYSCQYRGASALQVIDIKSIWSVVAMVKHSVGFDLVQINVLPSHLNYGRYQVSEAALANSFFLVEKQGLEILQMGGYQENITVSPS